MAQRDPLPPPSASWHSGRLDVLLDEESILEDVLAVARPAIKRGGPVACIAAYTLEHLACAARRAAWTGEGGRVVIRRVQCWAPTCGAVHPQQKLIYEPSIVDYYRSPVCKRKAPLDAYRVV